MRRTTAIVSLVMCFAVPLTTVAAQEKSAGRYDAQILQDVNKPSTVANFAAL